MNNTTRIIALLAATLATIGCQQQHVDAPAKTASKNYARPLPAGQSPLRRVTDPQRLTAIDRAWNDRDLFLRDAADESITWFDKPSTL